MRIRPWDSNLGFKTARGYVPRPRRYKAYLDATAAVKEALWSAIRAKEARVGLLTELQRMELMLRLLDTGAQIDRLNSNQQEHYDATNDKASPD